MGERLRERLLLDAATDDACHYIPGRSPTPVTWNLFHSRLGLRGLVGNDKTSITPARSTLNVDDVNIRLEP